MYQALQGQIAPDVKSYLSWMKLYPAVVTTPKCNIANATDPALVGGITSINAGEDLVYTTPTGAIKVLSGGTVETAITQFVYKPGAVAPTHPVYDDFTTLMAAVATNQSEGIISTIYLDNSIQPIVITQSYDMSNCQITGINEAFQNPIDVSFTGAGCFVNPHTFVSVNINVSDYTAPRIRYTVPNQTFRFISTRYVPSITQNEVIIQIEANNIFWYLDLGSALLNEGSDTFSYINFVGGNHALSIICLYGGGFGSAVFNSNGNTPIIQLFADSTASPIPTTLTDVNITYLVDPVSNAPLVVYPDGNGGFELCAKPLAFPNRPSVAEALDGCKRGFQRLYLRPNAPPNGDNFPFFASWTEILLVVNNPANASKLYEIVLDDAYQNPVQMGDVNFNCQSRVSFIGIRESISESQRVNVTISNTLPFTGIKNPSAISFLNIAMTQPNGASACLAWDQDKTCVFNNCSLSAVGGTQVPIDATVTGITLRLEHCILNASTNFIFGATGGTLFMELIDTSTPGGNLIELNGAITTRLDSTTATANAALAAPMQVGFTSVGERVYYAANNQKVPSPAVPNNVSVSEMIKALDTLQTDNTTSPSNVVIVSGNGATLSVSNDPLSVANIGAQSISFFGSTPISRPTATGELAGYTANASVNVVYNESTFTGNIGASAYTLNDIVACLKNLGLLST